MVSNINLLESRRRILLNTPHIETVSDTVASFKTDIATKIKGCKIHFTPTQEGEGDPSPDNVRPIHGWDGITVTKCGKNLAPLFSNTDFWSMAAWFDDKGIIHNDDNYRMCDYKIVSPGKKYVLSTTTACWKGIGFYDELYNPLKFNQQNAVSIELTCPDNAKYYRVYIFYNDINIQFEEGSIATEYEPYQSTTLTIPFPQTIYGGYVDLVKGEVVEEWTKRNLNAFSQTIISGGGFQVGHWLSSGWEKKNGTDNFISDVFKRVISGTVDQTMKGYGNTYPILLYDSSITTVNEFKEKYADNYIVYAIRHPNTYSIDPQTLKALRGMNNIWSDANGNIEVSFYTH